MLYVTTASPGAYHTAQYVLCHGRSREGELFVPLRLPRFDREELEKMVKLSFWDCVAGVMNLFFPLRLKGEDFASIPALQEPELDSMRYKVDMVGLWSNTKGSSGDFFAAMSEACGCPSPEPGSWISVAVRVALLFGLYGKLRREGRLPAGELMRPAMVSGELDLASAVLYAGEMGLPMGTALCVCNENGLPWELFHRGEARLDGETASTVLPRLDVSIPVNLERFISLRLGWEEARRYRLVLERRRLYALTEEQAAVLRRGFAFVVTGAARGSMMIPRIYKNDGLLLSPYTAFLYSGLTDYRSREGEGAGAQLLGEESPMRCAGAVLAALGIPAESVTAQLQELEQRAAQKRRGS